MARYGKDPFPKRVLRVTINEDLDKILRKLEKNSLFNKSEFTEQQLKKGLRELKGRS